MPAPSSRLFAPFDLGPRRRRGRGARAPDRATFYGGGERGYTDYPALASA
jgi:N-ethylmaleimide reductase